MYERFLFTGCHNIIHEFIEQWIVIFEFVYGVVTNSYEKNAPLSMERLEKGYILCTMYYIVCTEKDSHAISHRCWRQIQARRAQESSNQRPLRSWIHQKIVILCGRLKLDPNTAASSTFPEWQLCPWMYVTFGGGWNFMILTIMQVSHVFLRIL